MMTVDDAQKFCSDKESAGVLHGTHWAYFYTSVYNFIHDKDDYGEGKHTRSISKQDTLNLKGMADDKGNYDYLIERLGLTKIDISAIPSVLEPLGVQCLV